MQGVWFKWAHRIAAILYFFVAQPMSLPISSYTTAQGATGTTNSQTVAQLQQVIDTAIRLARPLLGIEKWLMHGHRN